MGIDQSLFRIDGLKCVELAAQLRAPGSRIFAFLGPGQDFTNAADVLDELLLDRPIAIEVRQLVFQCGDVVVDRDNALVVLYPKDAVADERRSLSFTSGNRQACILDQGRRRALADGYAC